MAAVIFPLQWTLLRRTLYYFQEVADRADVELELSPLLISSLNDGIEKFGPREFSPNNIKRLEERTGLSILADGVPTEMEDDESEEPGYEVKVAFL